MGREREQRETYLHMMKHRTPQRNKITMGTVQSVNRAPSVIALEYASLGIRLCSCQWELELELLVRLLVRLLVWAWVLVLGLVWLLVWLGCGFGFGCGWERDRGR